LVVLVAHPVLDRRRREGGEVEILDRDALGRFLDEGDVAPVLFLADVLQGPDAEDAFGRCLDRRRGRSAARAHTGAKATTEGPGPGEVFGENAGLTGGD